MNAWLLLALAIIAEVGATLSLRMVATGARRWYAPMLLGYALAFIALALTLSLGMPLGAAYGIWTACGVALTALLGKLLFNEPLTWLMGLGIALIAGGVLLIEAGSAP